MKTKRYIECSILVLFLITFFLPVYGIDVIGASGIDKDNLLNGTVLGISGDVALAIIAIVFFITITLRILYKKTIDYIMIINAVIMIIVVIGVKQRYEYAVSQMTGMGVILTLEIAFYLQTIISIVYTILTIFILYEVFNTMKTKDKADSLDKIQKLKLLLDNGAISEEEYNKEKEKLLNS